MNHIMKFILKDYNEPIFRTKVLVQKLIGQKLLDNLNMFQL